MEVWLWECFCSEYLEAASLEVESTLHKSEVIRLNFLQEFSDYYYHLVYERYQPYTRIFRYLSPFVGLGKVTNGYLDRVFNLWASNLHIMKKKIF